jgi:inhibitor of KinA sporulation pathway (predicted exonuclease)
MDEFLSWTQPVMLLDLEFTCWKTSLLDGWSNPERPPEVIEIAVAAYDVAKNSVSDHFTSFVRPQKNLELSLYCQNLLNISQSNVSQAPLLDSVVARIVTWRTLCCPTDTPTCSWGMNDRLFLARDAARSNCPDPFRGCRHVDLRSLFRAALADPTDVSCDRDRLRATLGLLPNLQRHRALNDVLDLPQYYQRLRAHCVSPSQQCGQVSSQRLLDAEG